jgi:hypothetical protein
MAVAQLPDALKRFAASEKAVSAIEDAPDERT